jgi:hypothetical protein
VPAKREEEDEDDGEGAFFCEPCEKVSGLCILGQSRVQVYFWGMEAIT